MVAQRRVLRCGACWYVRHPVGQAERGFRGAAQARPLVRDRHRGSAARGAPGLARGGRRPPGGEGLHHQGARGRHPDRGARKRRPRPAGHQGRQRCDGGRSWRRRRYPAEPRRCRPRADPDGRAAGLRQDHDLRQDRPAPEPAREEEGAARLAGHPAPSRPTPIAATGPTGPRRQPADRPRADPGGDRPPRHGDGAPRSLRRGDPGHRRPPERSMPP